MTWAPLRSRPSACGWGRTRSRGSLRKGGILGRFLSSRWGPVITGAAIGILAPVLVKLGNPGNMGVGIVCFLRDTAGALGLHRTAIGQYIRPEISGLVLGALTSALLFGEFRPRTGSAPLLRFVLGMCAAIGALVFLGCPWRAYLRLAGGDWSALWGILGLIGGVALGVVFLRLGFGLGPHRPAPPAQGWVVPVLMAALLVLLLVAPQFRRDAEGNPTGPIFFSTEAPGSQHAPLLASLAAGLVIGFLAQRSRFCTIAALRDVIMMRNPHLLYGVGALVVAAYCTNSLLGAFSPGFAGQPVAQTDALWNVGGMLLCALASTLAGGCPGRQLFLCGEGDGDAGVFVLGMLAGAAFAQNWNAASCPEFLGLYGPALVTAGLSVCIGIGLTAREPAAG